MLELFWAFFRIGCMMFGGGYVMLPLLQREVVEKRGWVTQEALLDCFALSQCTPGAIAVNAATYVGYQRRGVWGGVVATFGVVLPSLLIICALAGILQRFDAYPAVVNAFAGVRVGVAALVACAVWKLYRQGVHGAGKNAICVGAFVLAILGISPVFVTLGALVFGVVLSRMRKQA